MPHSPRLAHKAPVMQATQVITHQAFNSNNRCVGTASPLDQNLILLLKTHHDQVYFNVVVIHFSLQF